jgi:hypothetical protein
MKLPRILVPGVVRSLKATHSLPLNEAPPAVRQLFLGYLVGYHTDSVFYEPLVLL